MQFAIDPKQTILVFVIRYTIEKNSQSPNKMDKALGKIAGGAKYGTMGNNYYVNNNDINQYIPT